MNLVKWLENENKDILTPQDALLTVAICAAEMGSGDIQAQLARIDALARSHPLFADEPDLIQRRINELFALVHNTDQGAAIGLAARSLTPELRETAFKWAVNMVLTNGPASEEKKGFLGTLVIQFMIDMELAEKIYAEASEIEG